MVYFCLKMTVSTFIFHFLKFWGLFGAFLTKKNSPRGYYTPPTTLLQPSFYLTTALLLLTTWFLPPKCTVILQPSSMPYYMVPTPLLLHASYPLELFF